LDVLRLSNELLTGGVSPYERYYSQLINGMTGAEMQADKDAVEINPNMRNTIQIIHWRLRAFVFLRRYNDLKMEIMRLRLLPSHVGTLPSWVPLSLILEGVESSTYDNNSNEEEDADAILDGVYTLRHTITKKDELIKLDIVLVNILVRREEWRLALGSLDNILEYAEEAVKVWLERNGTRASANDVEVLTKAIKVEMYSRQGKILLQAGALPAAATVFERAHYEYQSMSPDIDTLNFVGNDLIVVRNVPTQILINEGLLHFAHIDYDLAEQKFMKAVGLQRLEQGRGNDNASRSSLSFDGLVDTEGDLLIPCLNNLALCTLYTCRMREAVNMMEGLIREDPTKYLTECMSFNLCTLYELGSDNARSEGRKRVLQSIAKRFTLHDIGPENFRLH